MTLVFMKEGTSENIFVTDQGTDAVPNIGEDIIFEEQGYIVKSKTWSFNDINKGIIYELKEKEL